MNKETMKNMVKEELLSKYDLMPIVQDINSWNGYLDWLDFQPMDFLDDYLVGNNPSWIIERVYYGDFNPNDDYFAFNGYGNLVSYDEWEAKKECEEYIDDIVEALIDNIDNIDTYEPLVEFINSLWEQLEV